MQIQNLTPSYLRDGQLNSVKRDVAPKESLAIGKVNEEAQRASGKPAKVEEDKQPQQTLNFDEKTLTELEQAAQSLALSSNSEGLANQETNSLAKEQISRNNLSAVSSYQLVGSLAQRESVQSMMGVDLFA